MAPTQPNSVPFRRLPDKLVQFLDEMVANGSASSRAAAVAAAVEREQRRDVAAQDARILSAAAASDDLNELAQFAADAPIELD